MWYVGLDWADTHHDMEVLDEAGKRVGAQRFAHSLEGLNQLKAFLLGIAAPEELACSVETVLLSDMVDKWTSPFQTHFGPVFRDEAVQRDLPFPEPGSICLFLRAPSPISPVLATFEIQREKGKPPY